MTELIDKKIAELREVLWIKQSGVDIRRTLAYRMLAELKKEVEALEK